MFGRESNQAWANEDVSKTLVWGTFNSATSQGVTDNFHPNTSFTRFFTQSGHGAYCYAAGIRNNSRQSTLSCFLDFGDNRLLIFES
jgi:hypothetical protein